jgi:hypothetical protein
MTASTSQTLTLGDAITHYDIDVLEHLDRQISIPVLTGVQRQGDVIFLPRNISPATTLVPKTGHPVVRGENGGNTHLLLDGFGGPIYFDPTQATAGNLRLGVLTVPDESVAFLAHPEHGYMGFGPGTYVAHRQREQADELRLVTD